LASKLIIAILVVLTVYLQARFWIGEGSFAHVDALTHQLDKKRAENEQKKFRNRVLKAEIIDLREGLDAVEERARTEFGLIKEDETFILLVND
jgi:cell division protein FtsB